MTGCASDTQVREVLAQGTRARLQPNQRRLDVDQARRDVHADGLNVQQAVLDVEEDGRHQARLGPTTAHIS